MITGSPISSARRLTYARQVGANASTLVTRTSSLGCWVPVHGAEWDGDVPIEPKSDREQTGSGKVVLSGAALPWSVGTYEVRLSPPPLLVANSPMRVVDSLIPSWTR